MSELKLQRKNYRLEGWEGVVDMDSINNLLEKKMISTAKKLVKKMLSDCSDIMLYPVNDKIKLSVTFDSADFHTIELTADPKDVFDELEHRQVFIEGPASVEALKQYASVVRAHLRKIDEIIKTQS